MSSRGRGARSSRRTGLLPNLSVAGKRETKAETSTAKTNSRERRERGRGGRGSRGGRGHADSKKPVYIEQAGIFSSGLNDDGRHDKPRVRDELFTGISGVRQRKVVKDIEMTEDLDYKPITYETEWLSDEEGDVKELAELLKDEFISDLKKGAVKPLVLPISDEAQFDDDPNNVVKKEACEISETPSSTKATSVDNKSTVRKANSKLEEKPFANEKSINPTLASSEEASALLKTISSSKDSSMMLWQLPSTLSVLASGSNSADSAVDQKPKPEIRAEVRHCLKDLPSGTELGVLRIRKSGKSELNIDGMLPLDITCAVPGQHQESVVMIQLNNQPNEVFGQIGSFKTEYSGAGTNENGIYVLGNLSNALICSHDFPQSIGMRRKIGARDKPINSGIDMRDSSVSNLMDELRRLKKIEESWKSWTDQYCGVSSDDLT